MRVSTKARYAIRAMTDLAVSGGPGTVTRDEIAERQSISPLYLSHILLRLGKAGLVCSAKGPGGGYRLSRPSSEIIVGEIVRAIGEPLDLLACLDSSEHVCPRDSHCASQRLWARLADAIARELDSITLEDLEREERQLMERETTVTP